MTAARLPAPMTGTILGSGFAPADLPEAPTAVMFRVSWCGYCTTFQPHFDAIPGSVVVDITDEEDPLWETLNIEVVPTVIVFNKTQPGKRWKGVLGKSHAAEIVTAIQG